MKSTKVSGLILLAAFSLCCGRANGQQTINVDFNGLGGSGTFSGVGAAPDAGTVWNGVVPPDIAFTSGPLVDSTGVATPVTVSLQAYLEYAANENPADFSHPLLTDFVYQTVLGPNGPASLFSINNLTPGGAYDLYFYSQNGGYANTATSFTINGNTKIATNPNIPGSSGPDSFLEDVNYVVFSGVVADGAGVISGAFNDVAPENNAAFNGFQIRQVPIPEPASIISAIIGGGLLLVGGAYRRRKVSHCH